MIRKQQGQGKQVRFIVSKARLMISVIVPVYKVESYLHQCLDSILGQTYRDLEILLIDDGSPDRCGEICEEYAKKDSRIRVFHTKNQGLSAARNLGLREAKGEYIGFVDSDDWIEPDMYEILLRRIEETGTNISASGVWKDYADKSISYSNDDGIYHKNETIRVLFRISDGMWNKLYKKICWADICFPENHTYEDVSILHKVFLKADSLSCVPKPLYHYRMREGSIIHSLTMENIRDYWTASYEKYSYLRELPEFENDREVIEKLEKKVALAAIKTWFWVYGIPKEKRDYDFLQTVSNSMQKPFPSMGKRNWNPFYRVCFFFSRHPGSIDFAIVRALMRFRDIVRKTDDNKLFPN